MILQRGLSYTRNCGQKVQWHGTYQDLLQVLWKLPDSCICGAPRRHNPFRGKISAMLKIFWSPNVLDGWINQQGRQATNMSWATQMLEVKVQWCQLHCHPEQRCHPCEVYNFPYSWVRPKCGAILSASLGQRIRHDKRTFGQSWVDQGPVGSTWWMVG